MDDLMNDYSRLLREIPALHPIEKGDVMVCVVDYMDQFTLGKHYVAQHDIVGTYRIAILCDDGNERLSLYYHPGRKEYCFLPLSVIRDEKLGEIGI